MNLYINKGLPIVNKYSYASPSFTSREEHNNKNLSQEILKNTLLGLSVLGMTFTPLSCTNSEDYEEVLESAAMTKFIEPQKVQHIDEYLEDLGFCLEKGSMKDVKTIKMTDTDNDGTTTFAIRIYQAKDAHLYLCKDIYGNDNVTDYITKFVKVSDGLEIYQFIPNVGYGCVKLVPEKDGGYVVYKRKFNNENEDISNIDVRFGTLKLSKEDHELYYTGECKPKFRTLKTVGNNIKDEVNWNWGLIAEVTGDENIFISDVDGECIDPYNN